MPRITFLTLAIITLTGCSVATLPNAPDRTFDIDASFDETWTALVAHISGEALPIGTLEKDSGLLTVNDTTLPYYSDAFACAKTKMESVSEIRIRMSFVAKSTGEGTSSLTINLVSQGFVEPIGSAVATAITGVRGNSRWAQCESLGTLEQSIMDGINQNLGP